MPLFNIAEAKTVDKTTNTSKNKNTTVTTDDKSSGDLLSIEINKVTKDQIKKVPVYKKNRESTFAATRNSYSSTYGYDKLANDTYKGVYQDLVVACEEFTKSNNDATLVSGNKYGAITVTVEENTIRTSELNAILCSLYYDHPEFYWLDSFGYTYNASDYIVSVTPFCSS